jgi:hypothetical protein
MEPALNQGLFRTASPVIIHLGSRVSFGFLSYQYARNNSLPGLLWVWPGDTGKELPDKKKPFKL